MVRETGHNLSFLSVSGINAGWGCIECDRMSFLNELISTATISDRNCVFPLTEYNISGRPMYSVSIFRSQCHRT